MEFIADIDTTPFAWTKPEDCFASRFLSSGWFLTMMKTSCFSGILKPTISLQLSYLFGLLVSVMYGLLSSQMELIIHLEEHLSCLIFSRLFVRNLGWTTILFIVQGYFDNITEYLRVGPPVYFVVKDYDYRFSEIFWLYICPYAYYLLKVTNYGIRTWSGWLQTF